MAEPTRSSQGADMRTRFTSSLPVSSLGSAASRANHDSFGLVPKRQHRPERVSGRLFERYLRLRSGALHPVSGGQPGRHSHAKPQTGRRHDCVDPGAELGRGLRLGQTRCHRKGVPAREGGIPQAGCEVCHSRRSARMAHLIAGERPREVDRLQVGGEPLRRHREGPCAARWVRRKVHIRPSPNPRDELRLADGGYRDG